MDQMTVGQRVGVKTNEVGKNGKPIPPRFFGRVVEVQPDGLSGYVDLEVKDEPGVIDDNGRRTHFHVDELETAEELRG